MRRSTDILSPSRSHIIPHLVLFLLLLAAPSAFGQFYFGKNKVQYTDFEWQVMTTEHFRIYFYTDEVEIAQIGARIAEDEYRNLARKFNHEIPDKTPLIIYSSPSYFSQTNVIPGLLPESVGGFTEFLKGRVVLPFHGSYHDFHHVLKHELVHVFQLSKLDHEVSGRNRVRVGLPPLWFTEGLAEYWSKDWDTEADMIVKDMVLNGKLITIPNMYVVHGTYFMYKLGESICHFINDYYGPEKIPQLYENWHKGKSFDDIVKITLGDNLEEVSRKWEYSLKKRYFPEIDTLGLPRMESQRITKDGYTVKGVPILYDDGNGEQEWLVFMSNRRGYTGIYMMPTAGGDIRTIVKGERSSDFESLHLLRSGIDATDSGRIIFSSKSKERDVIYLYDLYRGRVTHRYEFKDLISARSPRFSPDGKRAVFSGVRTNGFADLYMLDLESGEYQALTSDIYYDVDPCFTLDGRKVVYVSDRGHFGKQGGLNVFEYDLTNGVERQLTFGNYHDQTPDCTPHGIYFSSDREGTFNLFLLHDDGSLTRQSTYVTGAFDPRLSKDGKTLTYTGYQDFGFQIYQMDIPDEPVQVSQPLASVGGGWLPDKIGEKYQRASIRYNTDYSFDIAQSNFGYDPVYGSIGGFQAAMSDILGNKAVYLLLTNTADTKDEFLSSFNFGLTFVNRENRLNWGVGVFHLYDEYYNDVDFYYDERQAGGLALLSYPISKFNRIEFSTSIRYSKKDRRYGLPSREDILSSNYLSWIHDNSLWDISGPIEGRRYNFTVGFTAAIDAMKAYNALAFADLRHYFRLGKYSAVANRLYGFYSGGPEPHRRYFGGSWSFRGFDLREWYVRKIVFQSTELRFPLIDNLLIGFPIGGLGFSGIRGAIFFDAGSAWEDEFDKLYWSTGAGFRVSLGQVVLLRFDFARTDENPSFDFDFFFGWNF